VAKSHDLVYALVEDMGPGDPDDEPGGRQREHSVVGQPEQAGLDRVDAQLVGHLAHHLGNGVLIFCTWVNRYCVAAGRADIIPPDPNGKLHPARLRRTLAWFIARKPCGMVAAAIQYGHVSVAMTLGYSNPRELHQAGEKPQVTSSWRRPDALEAYYQPVA
jgi:hypothetical protein